MTILNELYASGGTDVIIHTLELDCASWPEPYVLCNGYVDFAFTTEDMRGLVATATGMDIALAKRDASAAQSLKFALDNIRGEVVQSARLAEEDGEEIRLTHRVYLASDPSSPAENPAHLIVRSFTASGPTVEVEAGYFDLIDMQFPRDVYNASFSPGLKYQ